MTNALHQTVRFKTGVDYPLPQSRRSHVKLYADSDKESTHRLGMRINMLIKAKQNGDPPPAELKAWLDNIHSSLAHHLIGLGLLEIQRRERDRPLLEQVDRYEKVVASRKTNDPNYAKAQASRVKKLITLTKARCLSDMIEENVLDALQELKRSVTTRRHYLVALKDFAKWMVKSKRARENPLEDIPLPAQFSDLTRERVPMTVEEFLKLTRYLVGFERYPKQIARWTAGERKLVYWTAVRTGYRQGELESLRVRSLLLDAKPPQIAVRAVHSKNGMAGSVPIPDNLAAALRKHVASRDPEDRLFSIPASRGCIVKTFHRDLDGAGIRWDLGEDSPYTIDFHTLRSTAITWWLDVDGLSPKRVQVLARLKTLALVAL